MSRDYSKSCPLSIFLLMVEAEGVELNISLIMLTY
jgi:hypothetical protein